MEVASCAGEPVHASSSWDVKVDIRAYNEDTDLQRADELEKQCEAGPSGQLSLFTDLLGDPLCRVRQYPAYAMLVAETQPNRKIVGLVRAGVKEVTRAPVMQKSGAQGWTLSPSPCKLPEHAVSCVDVAGEPSDEGQELNRFVSIAYVLGLRVAPSYRRLGIGAELVKKMEDWCREKGADYVYIATEKDNEASVSLFTKKLGYAKFRSPAILVQPVYIKSKRLSKKVQVVELSREEACIIYKNRSLFGVSEFFPNDIEAVVKSNLHRGTWLAYWKDEKCLDDLGCCRFCARDYTSLHCTGSHSWAVISLWKCNEIFQLQMKGAPLHLRGAAAASRALGRMLSLFLTIPTMPNVFKPFGLQLIYGLQAQGPRGFPLARHLCWLAHNMAKSDGCAVVAAEVASCDPLRQCIPHWTCDEDMWCIKRIANRPDQPGSECVEADDWSKSLPPPSLFLDPRDF